MARVERFDLVSTAAMVHRVLVVEDDRETAQLLKEFLRKHGMDVVWAKDGGQAQSSFTMQQPDFVLLDLILPRESGFEVCERMKKSNKNVPIIVLTAIDMEDSRDLAARVGADGYVTKPFDPEQLLKRMHEIADFLWRKSHVEPEGPTHREDEDRVRFQCTCGRRFKVSSQHRGRILPCPQCGEPIMVPTSE